MSRSRDTEEFHVLFDTLEVASTRRQPIKARRVRHGVARRLGRQHGAGARRGGHAASQVDRTAEPVTRPAYRAPRRDADPQAGQVVDGRRLSEIQDCRYQRSRLVGHQHHRVPDRLDEPNRRSRDVVGQFGEPAGDAFVLLGLQRLAQLGEPGKIRERDGHWACAGQ
jgi:hypothetical protein